MREGSFFVPKTSRLCECFASEKMAFKPDITTFLLCEISGGNNMDNQPIKPTDTTQPTQPKQTTVVPTTPKPIEVTKPPIKPFTKEQTAEALKALTDPKKEVRPMAKDPMNMFDYSDCKTAKACLILRKLTTLLCNNLDTSTTSTRLPCVFVLTKQSISQTNQYQCQQVSRCSHGTIQHRLIAYL